MSTHNICFCGEIRKKYYVNSPSYLYLRYLQCSINEKHLAPGNYDKGHYRGHNDDNNKTILLSELGVRYVNLLYSKIPVHSSCIFMMITMKVTCTIHGSR